MARYFRGSAGICITTLLLPDQPPGESKRERRKLSEQSETRRESTDTVSESWSSLAHYSSVL